MSFNSTIRNEIFNFRRRAPFTIPSFLYFFDGSEMVINQFFAEGIPSRGKKTERGLLSPLAKITASPDA